MTIRLEDTESRRINAVDYIKNRKKKAFQQLKSNMCF